MTRTNLLSATIALSIPVAAITACQSGTAPPSDEPGARSLQLGAHGAPCTMPAGIEPGGPECPEGYLCQDNPRDACVPNQSSEPCPGTCAPDQPKCLDPNRFYVSRYPDLCIAITFLCVEGTLPFFDDCGCGCEAVPPPPGEPCGENVCTPREFCCNESCSICAPLGGSCIQIECE